MAAAKKSKAHPGFKSVSKQIQAKGKGKYTKEQADAIAASAARNASPAAKRKNSRLKKV